jgi:hypothetical protein
MRKGIAYGKLIVKLFLSQVHPSWGISTRQLQSITFGKVQGCVSPSYLCQTFFMCNDLSMKEGSLFCFVLFCFKKEVILEVFSHQK